MHPVVSHKMCGLQGGQSHVLFRAMSRSDHCHLLAELLILCLVPGVLTDLVSVPFSIPEVGKEAVEVRSSLKVTQRVRSRARLCSDARCKVHGAYF